MIDHVTQIAVEEADSPRAAGLVAALAARGFRVRASQGRLVAESNAVEAGETKRHLRALGYADREYRVHVEYARKWGFL